MLARTSDIMKRYSDIYPDDKSIQAMSFDSLSAIFESDAMATASTDFLELFSSTLYMRSLEPGELLVFNRALLFSRFPQRSVGGTSQRARAFTCHAAKKVVDFRDWILSLIRGYVQHGFPLTISVVSIVHRRTMMDRIGTLLDSMCKLSDPPPRYEYIPIDTPITSLALRELAGIFRRARSLSVSDINKAAVCPRYLQLLRDFMDHVSQIACRIRLSGPDILMLSRALVLENTPEVLYGPLPSVFQDDVATNGRVFLDWLGEIFSLLDHRLALDAIPSLYMDELHSRAYVFIGASDQLREYEASAQVRRLVNMGLVLHNCTAQVEIGLMRACECSDKLDELKTKLGSLSPDSFAELDAKTRAIPCKLLPCVPGHPEYRQYRMRRFDVGSTPTAATVCHELLLDPGFDFSVSDMYTTSLVEEVDIFVMRGDLSDCRPPSFETMNKMLEYQSKALRCMLEAPDSYSEDDENPFARNEGLIDSLFFAVPVQPLFNSFISEAISLYEIFHTMDRALLFWGPTGEYAMLHTYLTSVLGDANVPTFEDALARNKAIFEVRVATFRERWARFADPVVGLSEGDLLDVWCDAVRFHRWILRCATFDRNMPLLVLARWAVCEHRGVACEFVRTLAVVSGQFQLDREVAANVVPIGRYSIPGHIGLVGAAQLECGVAKRMAASVTEQRPMSLVNRLRICELCTPSEISDLLSERVFPEVPTNISAVVVPPSLFNDRDRLSFVRGILVSTLGTHLMLNAVQNAVISDQAKGALMARMIAYFEGGGKEVMFSEAAAWIHDELFTLDVDDSYAHVESTFDSAKCCIKLALESVVSSLLSDSHVTWMSRNFVDSVMSFLLGVPNGGQLPPLDTQISEYTIRCLRPAAAMCAKIADVNLEIMGALYSSEAPDGFFAYIKPNSVALRCADGVVRDVLFSSLAPLRTPEIYTPVLAQHLSYQEHTWDDSDGDGGFPAFAVYESSDDDA